MFKFYQTLLNRKRVFQWWSPNYKIKMRTLTCNYFVALKKKIQSLKILHISDFAFLEKMALLTWVFYVSNTETHKINEVLKR